jgi:hypothetical protein
VDDVKKSLVNKWKRERGRNLEKKYIMNSLNVSGIPRNMVNAYRAGATNYIMIHSPNQGAVSQVQEDLVEQR